MIDQVLTMDQIDDLIDAVDKMYDLDFITLEDYKHAMDKIYKLKYSRFTAKNQGGTTCNKQ